MNCINNIMGLFLNYIDVRESNFDNRYAWLKPRWVVKAKINQNWEIVGSAPISQMADQLSIEIYNLMIEKGIASRVATSSEVVRVELVNQ